jgi:hypothetical protein
MRNQGCWGPSLPPLKWWQVFARIRRWWRTRRIGSLRVLQFPVITHARPTLSVDEMVAAPFVIDKPFSQFASEEGVADPFADPEPPLGA